MPFASRENWTLIVSNLVLWRVLCLRDFAARLFGAADELGGGAGQEFSLQKWQNSLPGFLLGELPFPATIPRDHGRIPHPKNPRFSDKPLWQ